jgi:hypothetical protein
MSATLPTPVADVELTDASASRVAMPPELREDLRRLLAKALVNDYLKDHHRTEVAADPSEGLPLEPGNDIGASAVSDFSDDTFTGGARASNRGGNFRQFTVRR